MDPIELNYNVELFKSINRNMIGRICYSPHLPKLLLLKRKAKCRVYLETGSLFGGSICYMMQDKQPCKFIGIDLFNGYYPNDSFGTPTDPITSLPVNIQNAYININKFNIHNHPHKLIKGSSYSEEVLAQVREELHSELIDFLFIDGDHSFSGVIQDWESYNELVRANGFVVFDNYSTSTWLDVKKAVDSIDFTGFEVIGVEDECFVVRKK